jgi:hypothetical protein
MQWCNSTCVVLPSSPPPPHLANPLGFAIHLFVRLQLSPGCPLEAGSSQRESKPSAVPALILCRIFLFCLMFHFLCFTITYVKEPPFHISCGKLSVSVCPFLRWSGQRSSLKSSVFWDITPCSPLKVNWRFGGTCRLHLQGRRVSQVRNLLVACFLAWLILRPWRWGSHVTPETSVDFQRTTQRYIPEDLTLHNHHCENLKAYNLLH